jgi:hypothetical protein
MSAIRPETRTAIHASVVVSWRGQDGGLHDSPALMEDKSPSGACIRTKSPIGVGTHVKIKWHWEEYFGTARYCRSDGDEYVVGIQRDPKDQAKSTPLAIVPVREKSTRDAIPLPTIKVQSAVQGKVQSAVQGIVQSIPIQQGVPSKISRNIIKTGDPPIAPSVRADPPRRLWNPNARDLNCFTWGRKDTNVNQMARQRT